jgi:drug/metabolite transporter (DMT)-like permease
VLAHLLLLLAAAIWGFAFVAQRKGMEYLDPFTFNALRFALGALFVQILGLFSKKTEEPDPKKQHDRKGPLLLGLLLFIASSFQQLGLLWTTAGSAGFITGLYVVFVPLIGLGRGQKIGLKTVLVMALSVLGLLLINGRPSFQASLGNLFVLVGAVFWAFHVQTIDRLTKLHSSLSLAKSQYLLSSLLSLVAGFIYNLFAPKPFSLPDFFLSLKSAVPALLYAGLMSVGLAFTLQLHAQKKVPPQAASVILCSEAVFAMFGGWLLLREKLEIGSLFGAALILAAMLLSIFASRLDFLIDKKTPSEF